MSFALFYFIFLISYIMKFTTLFKSENSDFQKITFITVIWDYNKLVIVSTKENISEEEMCDIANILIDNEIVKDEFNVFNIYITAKQVTLAHKLK